MASFEEAWKAACTPRAGTPSEELRTYLEPFYKCCVSESTDPKAISQSLDRLLAYLETDGRTSANCWVTDLFVMECACWERDWGDLDLPEPLHDVLSMMGEALHDTIHAPEVAKNFGCLPEQLRTRLRQIALD